MKRSISTDRLGQTGTSMVEVNIVILLIFAVSGIALVNMQGILPALRSNAGLSDVLAQLRTARELAIAQRRNIEVRFQGNNQIQLVRTDVPTGNTVLSTVTLENNVDFRLFGGVPDTPDSFGNSSAVYFRGSTLLMFLSDGTFVDAQGNPLNGSVFLGLNNHPETARAVTVLGATGRVRGYRWTGSRWIQ